MTTTTTTTTTVPAVTVTPRIMQVGPKPATGILSGVGNAIIWTAIAVEETARVGYSAAFMLNTLIASGQVYAENFHQSALLEGQIERARLLKVAEKEGLEL